MLQVLEHVPCGRGGTTILKMNRPMSDSINRDLKDFSSNSEYSEAVWLWPNHLIYLNSIRLFWGVN